MENTRELIEKYKKLNRDRTALLDKLDRETFTEVSYLRTLEKEISQVKASISDTLDDGVKILSDNWSFNKGMPSVRRTPDAARVKKLQDLLDQNNLFYIDEHGHNRHFVKPLFKETKVPARLTITEKKEKNET